MADQVTRQPGWEWRLVALAEARVGKPFAWGTYDCAILVFEAYDALKGSQLAARFRARYLTEGGARRFQKRYDVDAERVLRAEGCIEVLPAFAQRGDALIVRRDGFACGHVCYGDRVLSATPGAGVGWGRMAALLAEPGLIALRIA